MKDALPKFYRFLDRPLYLWSRGVLAALVLPLALSIFLPLWRIHMEAPQYPDGLTVDIYTYKLQGGNDGRDLPEINTLNHYIGMRHIDRSEMNDLDWMPFALGGLALLALRVAAIGNVRALLDLGVLVVYVFGFAFARFVFKLYSFGHDLSPDAPMKVAPFTPAILGTKQIANFLTSSLPRSGALLGGVFVGGVLLLLLLHLVRGRLDAARGELLAVAP